MCIITKIYWFILLNCIINKLWTTVENKPKYFYAFCEFYLCKILEYDYVNLIYNQVEACWRIRAHTHNQYKKLHFFVTFSWRRISILNHILLLSFVEYSNFSFIPGPYWWRFLSWYVLYSVVLQDFVLTLPSLLIVFLFSLLSDNTVDTYPTHFIYLFYYIILET